MLKKYITTVLFCCMGTIGFTQTMIGNWTGNYTEGRMNYPIKLTFTLNADSSFTIQTHTKLPDNNGKGMWVICDVYYEFMGKDSLYLEETHRVMPDEKNLPSCLQKMYLKIKEKKKILVLEGVWRDASSNQLCGQGGDIYFSKKKTTP